MLSLPMFTFAGQLGLSNGLSLSLGAAVCGAAVLSVIAMFTGYIGTKTGFNTYRILQCTFGQKGSLLINTLMAVTLIFWFGITVTLFADALMTLPFKLLNKTSWIVFGSILMIMTAVKGYKALKITSFLSVPALLLLVLVLNYSVVSHYGFDLSLIENTAVKPAHTFTEAMSSVIGCLIVGATILPDFSRFAKSAKSGVLAGFLIFFPAYILVLTLGILPAVLSGQDDMIAHLVSSKWPFLAFLVIFLTIWSNNDNNLYSASMALTQVFQKADYMKLTLIIGVLGSLTALLGILDHMMPFLGIMSIIIPPISIIYIVDFFLNRSLYSNVSKNKIIRADTILALLLSGLFPLAKISLTGINVLDNLLAAFFLSVVFISFSKKKLLNFADSR
jgi:cytosine permease